MNCPNCSSPLRPNQKFCERCGAKIEQPVTNFDNPQQPSAAPTQVYQPEPEDPGARTRVYVPQTEYADKDNPLNNQPNFDVQEPEQPEYAPQQYRQAPRPGEYPPQPSEYPPQPVGYAPQQRQNPYPQPADNGGKPPKKSKTPLIIVIIVLAVLLVGGGIVTAILLLNPNNKDDGGDSASGSASSQSSQAESSKAPDTSSRAESSVASSSSPQSSKESSSWSFDSSSQAQSSFSWNESGTYSSSNQESSFSSVPSSNSTALYGKSGALLADDPAINVDDSTSEVLMTRALESQNIDQAIATMNSQLNGKATVDMYMKGNTLVLEVNANSSMTDAEKAAFEPSMANSATTFGTTLKTFKDNYGINLAVVIALVEDNGNVYYSKVVKA